MTAVLGNVTVSVSFFSSLSPSAICASYSNSRISICPLGKLLSHSRWYLFVFALPETAKFESVIRSLSGRSFWAMSCSLGKNVIFSSPA